MESRPSVFEQDVSYSDIIAVSAVGKTYTQAPKRLKKVETPLCRSPEGSLCLADKRKDR